MANGRRLIVANMLLGIVNEIPDRKMNGVTIAAAIAQCPTVDAVEVVHGNWVIDEADSGELDNYAAYIDVHCSKCGYEIGIENGQYGWTYGEPFPMNYCPNCGAKMDRKDDDK